MMPLVMRGVAMRGAVLALCMVHTGSHSPHSISRGGQSAPDIDGERGGGGAAHLAMGLDTGRCGMFFSCETSAGVPNILKSGPSFFAVFQNATPPTTRPLPTNDRFSDSAQATRT